MSDNPEHYVIHKGERYDVPQTAFKDKLMSASAVELQFAYDLALSKIKQGQAEYDAVVAEMTRRKS